VSDFAIKEVTLDILASLDFDKETMLNDLFESSGLPLDVFLRYLVLEEYPVVITQIENHPAKETILKVSQEFRIRMKTLEEMGETLPQLAAS